MRVMPFLQHELCGLGIAINPSKAVSLPPKGRMLTSEDIARLRIGVRIAEGGEGKGGRRAHRH